MRLLRCVSLLAGLLPGAELLTFDAAGTLRGVSPALPREAGYALVSREALAGAASAAVIDTRGGLNPVLWISGDDPDAGVAEVFLGLQAPAGAARAPEIGKTAVSGGRTATVRYVKESGAFGWIARLEFEGGAHPPPGPLLDEQGRLLGWHAVKTVDGMQMHFGIPIARLDAIHDSLRLSLNEWNARQDSRGEAEYQRALGHLWAEDFDGARYYFNRAAEQRPAHARAWLHLGFVEAKTGHTRRGIECYENAIRHDPKLAPAYYYLGFALGMSGEAERARPLADQLEKLDPALAARLRTFLDISHVDKVEKGGAGLQHKH
jgi:tetratricopeptide (TPR) repeat protein